MWNKCKIPVYFILVILEHHDRFNWVEHHSAGTDQQAAAFWVRVDSIGPTENVVIPKNQRLTIETLNQWAEEVEECFSPR